MQAPGRAAGFEPRLFAAEPEIYKPLCMTWDHRGRLWIAESTDYPNTKRRDGQGRDRITICEDTDGDGRADSFKVFAEGLNIPTSLLCRRRRRDRAPGARHAFPQGYRRRRPGRSDEGALHGLGHRRHPRRAEQPALGLRQLGLGDRRLLGVSRHRRRREPFAFGQGLYRFKPDGSKLEFAAQHQQQLVGRRLQRGRPGLRLDGQRLPERLSADPQPLLRGGARLGAVRLREHRGIEHVLSR